ncbi:sulfocyanin [Sulfurisphaera ohwakuensis]|uniref:sulfocyanin n=1 Tax=Sulfurisphaera ohwakuensis TaxID=69656 RepID=UPI0036F2B078
MRKAVSPTFTAIVAIVVAIVIVGAAVYTYQQFLMYSSKTSAAITTTSTTPKHILPYNPSNKTVFITLVTLSSGPTFNFNGTDFGAMVIYVPAGWNLYITFINQQSLPHNLNLVANDTSTPNSANIAADGKILLTIGASSSDYQTTGIMSGQSASGLYTDIPAGIYWLCCGIAGHAESGMWVVLVASPNVTTPYVIIS